MSDPIKHRLRSTKRHEWYAGHSSRITCATIGRLSHRVLATGSDDTTSNIFRIGKPTPIFTLNDNTTPITAIQFDVTEVRIATGSLGGTTKIYDLGSGTKVNKAYRSFSGHKSAVTTIDWYPNASPFVASGSNDASVKLWDLRKQGCAQHLVDKNDPAQAISCIKFAPDGRWLFAGNTTSTVKLYDLQVGKSIQSFTTNRPRETILSIECHPVELIVAVTTPSAVYVWDMEDFTLLSVTPTDRNLRTAVFTEYHPDIVLTGSDTHVKAWNYYCNTDAGGGSNQTATATDVVECSKWGNLLDMTVTEPSAESSVYELTALTRTGEGSVAIHTIDLTATDYYQHQSLDEDAAPELRHSRADSGKQPTLPRQRSNDGTGSQRHRSSNSLNVNGHHIDTAPRTQPQATPSKAQSRAIDHPNEAFFSNDFSRQGNVSVMRDDKVGSVVLAPTVQPPQQPAAQPRPATGINLNALVASVSSHNGDSHQQPTRQPPATVITPTLPSNQPVIQPAVATASQSHHIPSPALSPNRRNQSAHDDAHLRKSRMHWPISQHPEKAIRIDEDIVDEVDESAHIDSPVPQATTPAAGHSAAAARPHSAAAPVVSQFAQYVQAASTHGNHQIFTQMHSEHEVLLTHLTPRLSQIRSLRKSWTVSDINTCFVELQSITDHVVSHTFLSTIESHVLPTDHTDCSIHLTLEQCHLLLVSLPRILSSPITPCVATALRYIHALLQLFTSVMQAALTQQSKSMGVDLARDERLAKAKECYSAFKHIYPRLPALSQRDNPVGPLASSVKSSLDTLIAVDKAQRASQPQQPHFSQLRL